MVKGLPNLIAINHNDYEAQCVGRTEDGRQFFLTTPFVPAIKGNPGREFLALYLFDKHGGLLEAWIEDLGTRAALDENKARAIQDQMLASLGPVKFRRIKVTPFRIERFGVEFGFIPEPPEEPGEEWSVIVEPGNYMAFFPPWSSGEYDT
jgi:hypothetical protein